MFGREQGYRVDANTARLPPQLASDLAHIQIQPYAFNAGVVRRTRVKDGRQVGAVARRDGDRLHAKAGVALQYNFGRKCGRAFQRDLPSTMWHQ